MDPEQRLNALISDIGDLAYFASMMLPQSTQDRSFFGIDPFADLILIRRAIEKLAGDTKHV